MWRRKIRGKTLIIRLDRLYAGIGADARDYEVEIARSKKLNIKFYVEDIKRWITIPYAKLDTGEVDSIPHTSKFDNARYPIYHLVIYTVRSNEMKEVESKKIEEKKREPVQLSAFEAIASNMTSSRLEEMRRAIKK